jgi:hypothetical protein
MPAAEVLAEVANLVLRELRREEDEVAPVERREPSQGVDYGLRSIVHAVTALGQRRRIPRTTGTASALMVTFATNCPVQKASTLLRPGTS